MIRISKYLLWAMAVSLTASAQIPFPSTSSAPHIHTYHNGHATHSGLRDEGCAQAVAESAVTLSAAQTIDGVSLLPGQLALLTAQGGAGVAHVDNGLWIVQAGSWLRPEYHSEHSSEKSGLRVWDENRKCMWEMIEPNITWQVDTDPQLWRKDPGYVPDTRTIPRLKNPVVVNDEQVRYDLCYDIIEADGTVVSADNPAGSILVNADQTLSDEYVKELIQECIDDGDIELPAATDDGGFALNVTGPDASGVYTISGTHTQSDGTANAYTDTIGSWYQSVDPDGVLSVADPASVCFPAYAWQRIEDHEGTQIDAVAKAQVLPLHRSLWIDAGAIAVSSEDSDDTDTGVISNHHLRSVQASTSSRASGSRSAVDAGNDVVLIGNYSASAGALRVDVSSSVSTVDASSDVSVAGGTRVYVGGATGVTLGAGNYSAYLGSSAVTTLAGSQSTNFVGGINVATISGAVNRVAVIGSGESTVVDSALGAIEGSQRCELNQASLARIGASTDCAILAQAGLSGSTDLLSSRYTETADANSTVWGWASVGPRSSANRTGRLATVGGNLDISGTVTTGVAFPGLAEVLPNLTGEPIPVGTIVAWVGRAVRPALPTDELGKDGLAKFGVVTAKSAAAFLAGDTPFSRHQRFALGDFGEILTEEIANPDKPDKSDPIPTISEIQLDAETGDPVLDDEGGAVTIEVPIYSPEEWAEHLASIPDTIVVPVETKAFTAARLDKAADQTPRSERPAEYTIVEVYGQRHTLLPEREDGNQWQPGEEIVPGIRLLEITDAEQNIGICFVGDAISSQSSSGILWILTLASAIGGGATVAAATKRKAT